MHRGDQRRAGRRHRREKLKTEIEAALADDDGVLWLTDRRGREIGVPVGQDRLHRDRRAERRPQDRLRRLSASGGSRGGRRPARPPAALRHRQGRRRQDHDRRGTRPARGEPGQAHARLRGRRQGQPRRLLRDRADSSSSPARSQPDLFAMAMDTEAVAAGVPAASSSSCRSSPASGRWPAPSTSSPTPRRA